MIPFLAALALQLYRGREAVDSATYVSASGAYELRVEPTRVDGTGEGAYRLLKDGQKLWSGKQDFTLRDARVTEQGNVFGYALTEGNRGLGHLRVLALASDGAVLTDELHERRPAGDAHSDPQPWILDVLLLDAADACVFRVIDRGKNQGKEAWWVFRAATGERLAEYLPAERLGHAVELGWKLSFGVHGAQTLDAQGLILAFGHGAGSLEQWFALLTPAGEPVWRLEEPDAFKKKLGGVSGFDLQWRVRNRGPLAPPPGADMRLWRVGEGAAVDYRVEPDDTAEHGWRVTEVGRSPDDGLAQAAEPERLTLDYLGAVPLERRPWVDEGLLGPVAAWGFDASGGLLLVRRSKSDGYEQVRVAPDGSIESVTPFDPPPERDGFEEPRNWTHLANERWLLTTNPTGYGANAIAFFADGATGKLQELTAFQCPAVDACAAAPDGGFAVLASRKLRFTKISLVVTFDAGGKERWRADEPRVFDRRDASMPGVVDVTVLADGSVALLKQTPDSIAFFDAAGAFVSSLDLAKCFGQEPNYLAGIEPAPEGGVLVYDFHASPPLRVVTRDGSLRASIDPVRADEYRNDALSAWARFGPDGALWTSDGNRFYRLDEGGREVAAFGAPPSTDYLREVAVATIDSLGRICIQDQQNGVLHVFDAADGSRLLIAEPKATDFESIEVWGRIAVGPDGGFVVEASGEGHVLFDASGRRTGAIRDERALDFAPETGASWSWLARGTIEYRKDAGEAHEIARFASGRWITMPDDVCALADGSFAVLADHEVGIFDSDGRALESFALPGTRDTFGDPSVGPKYLRTVTASRRWILASSWQRDAWLIDRAGGEARLFQAAEVEEDHSAEMALNPSGDEILVLDRNALVLHRYALP